MGMQRLYALGDGAKPRDNHWTDGARKRSHPWLAAERICDRHCEDLGPARPASGCAEAGNSGI